MSNSNKLGIKIDLDFSSLVVVIISYEKKKCSPSIAHILLNFSNSFIVL